MALNLTRGSVSASTRVKTQPKTSIMTLTADQFVALSGGKKTINILSQGQKIKNTQTTITIPKIISTTIKRVNSDSSIQEASLPKTMRLVKPNKVVIRKDCSDDDVQLVHKKLAEAQRDAEKYRLQLQQKEQEAEKYRQKLQSLTKSAK